jgi:alpha-1,3-mannosyltransferase
MKQDRIDGRQGERDYRQLKGQTGPLVYPAGFVYVFSALHWATGGGDVASAQAYFGALYLLTQAVVLWLYIRAQASSSPLSLFQCMLIHKAACGEAGLPDQVVPPWALGLLALSKRMHSIFVLRLFNDGVAMLLAYAATGACTF